MIVVTVILQHRDATCGSWHQIQEGCLFCIMTNGRTSKPVRLTSVGP
jgi:hypothetical protein